MRSFLYKFVERFWIIEKIYIFAVQNLDNRGNYIDHEKNVSTIS